MKVPRRSRKKLKPYTPNSPPEGLNQVTKAQPFQDKRESHACDVFRETLKPNGWRSFKRGSLDNWSFIPASLLERYKSAVIFKEGTKGYHYAVGWSGLADMLDDYEQDHAPTDLEPPEERPRRLDCDSSNDDEFGDDDSMAETSQSETSEDGKQHVTNEDLHDDDDEEEGWADNDDANEIRVKEEDADDDASATTSSPALSVALDNLRKCREELFWLQNNPEFHGADEAEVCKDIMRNTIASLYSEISSYTTPSDADSNGS